MQLKKEHLNYFLGYFKITFFGSLNKICFFSTQNFRQELN
jgi:hypothetical protein